VSIRLIRAIVAGCKAEPTLNASFDSHTLSLNPNDRIDLGLAIDSPDGLFVPVLRDVARSQPADWRRQIDAYKNAVRERSLLPAEMRGPTITLSNFGTITGTHAALVIVPPQVAILGAGRISARAVRIGSEMAFHASMPLSLTFDHRAINGGEAARFLRAVIADLRLPT
jgi:pyruvate dehydrogenase E2 component (dihydrolipoamide acetyltransferase)